METEAWLTQISSVWIDELCWTWRQGECRLTLGSVWHLLSLARHSWLEVAAVGGQGKWKMTSAKAIVVPKYYQNDLDAGLDLEQEKNDVSYSGKEDLGCI